MHDDNVIELIHKPDADAGSNGVDASPAEEKVLGFDDLWLYPRADDPYVAHSRPHQKSPARLLILPKDSPPTACSYHDLRLITGLRPQHPGGAPGLLLLFVGIARVELWGSHLDWLFGQLDAERIAWIRELPEGWAVKDDSAVIITSITIKLLLPVAV